ncbi:FkbM family methyltransferase [Hasllibacter sp. MH4015]|uniref:FkbM family methyltransferase n=1 Tax=Hasllibacter sp. MH4015 TaxID=2854029 RepID=UPI001CD6403C|nr:FkbM family methyltransferase [Hasllibacter sp. MH4015]
MAADDRTLKKLDTLIRHTRQNTQMIERHFAHQVWQGLGADKVVSFPYHGADIRFFVPDGWLDAVQRIILLNRTFYEAHLLEKIRALVPPGATFVDAGANIGNHAVYFAKLCRAAHVHAFEAMPHMQAVLGRNAELNGPDQITVHPFALGAAEGTADVAIFNPANLGSTTLEAGRAGSIPVRTLDSFALQDVAFIKIDVEGMQDAVLDGARDTIARCRPTMVIEAFDRGEERVKTQTLLGELGYGVAEIVGHNIIAIPAQAQE